MDVLIVIPVIASVAFVVLSAALILRRIPSGFARIRRRSVWQFVGQAVFFAYYGHILEAVKRPAVGLYGELAITRVSLPVSLVLHLSWWPSAFAVLAICCALYCVRSNLEEERLQYYAKVLLIVGTFLAGVTAIAYMEPILNPAQM